ncbi:MAG: alanine racemase [Candidatus Eutrophobiaceae bacterium]
MSRPSRVVIDRQALLHNYRELRKRAGHARIMFVVKADAYGHGLVRIAALLPEADAFGVACLEEAQTLRSAGIKQRIVLLEGIHKRVDVRSVAELELDIVIHNHGQLELLESSSPLRRRHVWIKIDTGMHRLGFFAEELPTIHERCQALDLAYPPILMSHFATASEPGHALTLHQWETFSALTDGMECEKSLANSAALLDAHKAPGDWRHDWVRLGLALYGVSPFAKREAAEFGLRPVMTMESELIAIRWLDAGEPVGYGASWRAPERMPIGIVAVGYGDGYPRHVPSGTPVMIRGTQSALVGRPSMDMLSVDLRACPQAKVGDLAILWGRDLPVERIARASETIPYELLCGVQHKRLHFAEV